MGWIEKVPSRLTVVTGWDGLREGLKRVPSRLTVVAYVTSLAGIGGYFRAGEGVDGPVSFFRGGWS